MCRQKSWSWARIAKRIFRWTIILGCYYVYGHNNTSERQRIEVQETDVSPVKNTTDGRPIAFIDEPDGDRTIEINEKVVFVGHGEDDGEITGHSWIFGTGTIPPPITTSPGPHTVKFVQEGTFEITYRVFDDSVPVQASPIVTRIITVLPPGAKIDTEWVFASVGSTAYALQSFEPAEANIGPINGQNPDLLLQIGDRYRVHVLDFETHPLQFIGRGTSTDTDVVILSMNNSTLSLDPNFEEDIDVNWVDSGDGTIEFTLTEGLINAMDFDDAHSPGYRSGGAPLALRGNIIGENQLFADFDLVGVYNSPEGVNSFSASSQSVFPFWFLELRNETITPPGATVTIDTVQFQAPYEFFEANPSNGTITNNDTSLIWNNIVLSPNKNEELLARQISTSEVQEIPISVTRAAQINGEIVDFPVEITHTDELELTVSITTADTAWPQLNVILGFFGFEQENFNPFYSSDSFVPPTPFATLELVSTTSPEGIGTGVEVEENDSHILLEWEFNDVVQPNQFYELRSKVRFAFESVNASATLDPMVIALGTRSGDEGTEVWDSGTLNLESPHTGSASLTGAVPNETGGILHVVGVQLYDQTQFLPETFSVSGNIDYDGTLLGTIIIQAFSDTTFSTTVGEARRTTPGPYTIQDLTVGMVYLRAFVDVNGDNEFDPDTEASGVLRSGTSPQAISLGPNAVDIDITINDPLFFISGEITYEEKQRGDVIIQVFLDDAFSMLVTDTTTPTVGDFTIPDLSVGMVYVRAFMDANDDGDFDMEREPSGVFPTSTNPETITLGPDATGINITLTDPLPLFSVKGVISYGGALLGTIRVRAFADATFTNLASMATTSGPGTYSVDNLPTGTYYLDAFFDINTNNEHDRISEPLGKFTVNGNTAIVVVVDQDIDNINITIPDLPDSDLDGLPDDWENANGLDSNNNNGRDGSDGDPDGDLLTNGQELAKGGHASMPTIQFKRGWNLVSWPQNSAEGITLNDQLNNIPWIGSVWTWDDTNNVHIKVTTKMQPTVGYWVFVTEEALHDVERNIAEQEPKDLKQNWNLTGGIHGGNVPDSPGIRSVWEWVGDRFTIPTSISSSKGYWVNTTTNVAVPNWP